MTSRILERRAAGSEEIFRALASETRTRILDLLAEREMNINEMRGALGIAHPSVSKHIQILEQAGLVTSEYLPGGQGTQKRCKLNYDRLIISMDAVREPDLAIYETEMPIGLYTLVHPTPPCGLASVEKLIGLYDEPQSFLLPERTQAQILWMSEGFIEYVFPNMVPTTMTICRVELSMEICSECPDYDNDYPSDITVWINGSEIGTWTSPGDMGERRGRLNPAWWAGGNTQHGLLKIWSVDPEASHVDGMLVSDTRLKDVMIAPRQAITVRIGVKPDAEHSGGFNLFGRGFGNYEQDITLRVHYQRNENDARYGRAGRSALERAAVSGSIGQ